MVTLSTNMFLCVWCCTTARVWSYAAFEPYFQVTAAAQASGVSSVTSKSSTCHIKICLIAQAASLKQGESSNQFTHFTLLDLTTFFFYPAAWPVLLWVSEKYKNRSLTKKRKRERWPLIHKVRELGRRRSVGLIKGLSWMYEQEWQKMEREKE